MAKQRVKHFEAGGAAYGDVTLDDGTTVNTDTVDYGTAGDGTDTGADPGNAISDPGDAEFPSVVDPLKLSPAQQAAQDAGVKQYLVSNGMSESDAAAATSTPGFIDKLLSKYSDGKGGVNWASVAKTLIPAAAGIAALNSNNSTNASADRGYQGGIPSLTLSRTKSPIPTDRRPGAGGVAYFSPSTFLGKHNMDPGPAGGTAGSVTTAPVGINTLPGSTRPTTNGPGPGTSAAPAGDIARIQQQLAGLKTQEDLDRFFATSGYSAAQLAAAAPQFGGVADYQNAMAKGNLAYRARTAAGTGDATYNGGPETTWANGFIKSPGDYAKYGQGAFNFPTLANGRIDTSSPAFTNFMATASEADKSKAIDQWNFNAQQTDRYGSSNPGNAGVGSFANNLSWMPANTYDGYAAKFSAGAASKDPLTAWLGGGAAMLTQDQYNAQNGRAAADAARGATFGGEAPPAAAPAAVDPAIAKIQADMGGLKTQDDLNKYFATSGYNASQFAQAAPQYGGLADYQNAIQLGAAAYNTAQAPAPAPAQTAAPAPAPATAREYKFTDPALYAGGGGISGLPGAAPQHGRFLRGPGDGVSDSIPARIDGKREARLADGEFVVPARIVSEIGNGSSEAGSRKLYAMLDRIEKTRHRNKNTAKDTRAEKHLPA